VKIHNTKVHKLQDPVFVVLKVFKDATSKTLSISFQETCTSQVQDLKISPKVTTCITQYWTGDEK
jgi:hypothetical protein